MDESWAEDSIPSQPNAPFMPTERTESHLPASIRNLLDESPAHRANLLHLYITVEFCATFQDERITYECVILIDSFYPTKLALTYKHLPTI
jgi:hypothetical protein